MARRRAHLLAARSASLESNRNRRSRSAQKTLSTREGEDTPPRSGRRSHRQRRRRRGVTRRGKPCASPIEGGGGVRYASRSMGDSSGAHAEPPPSTESIDSLIAAVAA